jgi:hypothetical protein
MNIGGVHGLKCKKGAAYATRHKGIVKAFVYELRLGSEGKVHCKEEPFVADYLDHLGGPAIGPTRGLNHPKFATTRADIAVTVSDNAQPTTIIIDAVTACINSNKITDAAMIKSLDGRMAAAAETRKVKHYAKFCGKPMKVVPLAVESGGRLGEKAEILLRRLARLTAPKGNDSIPSPHEVGLKHVKLRKAIAFANAVGVARTRIALRNEFKRLALRNNTNVIGDISNDGTDSIVAG